MDDTNKFMSGRICLVTGATSGLGEATALCLAQLGATVIVVGRNPDKCASSVEKISRRSGNPCIEPMVADLSVQDQIRTLAHRFKAKHRRLDVLINNAGARFLSRSLSADGLEMNFALNHLAGFMLTNLLLKELLCSNQGRIVNVSSAAHGSCQSIDFEDLRGDRGYNGKRAYAQSKLANVLFTYELARQLAGTGLTVNALDPGNMVTNFSRNNGRLSWIRHMVGSWLTGGLAGAKEGAKTCVYLAAAPELEGVSGKYFRSRAMVDSSTVSHDAEAAKRLWDVSMELAGFTITSS